jgi:hypothetical protein
LVPQGLSWDEKVGSPSVGEAFHFYLFRAKALPAADDAGEVVVVEGVGQLVG